MELFRSSGPLRYRQGDKGVNLRVEVDPGIVSFYRSLVPFYIKLNKQMYEPHISVVRNETPPNMEHWGKYEGEVVDFTYTNHIYNGTVYWWLNAFSNRLEEVRLELGLPVSSEYTRPPDGWVKCFHVTIGNCKGL